MHKKQILIIDDDEILVTMLVEYLADEAYQVEVVHDGLVGLNKACAETFDLIILDVMLPTLGGLEILKRLRQEKNTPVLMLTARGDDIDRILGLEIGADDYLPKPFNPRELLARMKAILRRSNIQGLSADKHWSIGHLSVNTERWSAMVHGKSIELTTAEFSILNALYEAKGKPVSREALTELALGRPMMDLERAIDTHMSNLRKKLKHYHLTSPSIKSVRGIGYVMVENLSSTIEESK